MRRFYYEAEIDTARTGAEQLSGFRIHDRQRGGHRDVRLAYVHQRDDAELIVTALNIHHAAQGN